MKESPDFITNPQEIMGILYGCKENASMVGIHSEKLGDWTYTTAVKDIVREENNGVVIIILNPYDSNGQMLPCTSLTLEDIDGVVPFTSPLPNPFLKQVQETGIESDRV